MTPAVHGEYRLQLLNFQTKILHCFKNGLVIGFPGMQQGAQHSLQYSTANKGFETTNYDGICNSQESYIYMYKYIYIYMYK